MNETRAMTVYRHVQQFLHETGVSWPAYGIAVVGAYHERTAPQLRGVLFHTQGDHYQCARLNAQILRRFLDGEHRLPAELEEALVLALQASWRERCLADLCARYGLLAARIPAAGEAQRNVGSLFKEAGEAGVAIAQMLETRGDIGPEDAQLADAAERELHDVIAVATTLLGRLAVARKKKGAKCSMPH